MNLYKLHDKPESIHGHDKMDTHVIDAFWDKYKDNPAELKKREKAIAKHTEYAHHYANILKGPFPAGEDAIAKDAFSSLYYAGSILKGRFPKGEKEIAKYPGYAYRYAEYVLKGPFKLGEDAISKNPEYAFKYAYYILKKKWSKGEDAINKDPYFKERYAREFK
jgi:hypothetical protein